MNAGLIILRIASERRDAQNERDGAGAAQLRRSSNTVAAALQPSTQNSKGRLIILHVASVLEVLSSCVAAAAAQLRRSSSCGRRSGPATMSVPGVAFENRKSYPSDRQIETHSMLSRIIVRRWRLVPQRDDPFAGGHRAHHLLEDHHALRALAHGTVEELTIFVEFCDRTLLF